MAVNATTFLYVASHIYLHIYKNMHRQTYSQEYIYAHRKDTNVFMLLFIISVAQQTYAHLANICHSTLQAVKYTWIRISASFPSIECAGHVSGANIHHACDTAIILSLLFPLDDTNRIRRALIHFNTFYTKKTHAHNNNDWILERTCFNILNHHKSKGVFFNKTN